MQCDDLQMQVQFETDIYSSRLGGCLCSDGLRGLMSRAYITLNTKYRTPNIH